MQKGTIVSVGRFALQALGFALCPQGFFWEAYWSRSQYVSHEQVIHFTTNMGDILFVETSQYQSWPLFHNGRSRSSTHHEADGDLRPNLRLRRSRMGGFFDLRDRRMKMGGLRSSGSKVEDWRWGFFDLRLRRSKIGCLRSSGSEDRRAEEPPIFHLLLLPTPLPLDQWPPAPLSYPEIWVFSPIFHLEDRSEDRGRPSTYSFDFIFVRRSKVGVLRFSGSRTCLTWRKVYRDR